MELTLGNTRDDGASYTHEKILSPTRTAWVNPRMYNTTIIVGGHNASTIDDQW